MHELYGVSLWSRPWALQLYRVESLHRAEYAVTGAVCKDMVKGTHCTLPADWLIMNNEKGVLWKEGYLTNVRLLLRNLTEYTVPGSDKPVNSGVYPAGNLRSFFQFGIAHVSTAVFRRKYYQLHYEIASLWKCFNTYRLFHRCFRSRLFQ